MISLTRSIGAVAVLATAPEIPPAAKSARNLVAILLNRNLLLVHALNIIYGLN
jgi:hypothetical protein